MLLAAICALQFLVKIDIYILMYGIILLPLGGFFCCAKMPRAEGDIIIEGVPLGQNGRDTARKGKDESNESQNYPRVQRMQAAQL